MMFETSSSQESYRLRYAEHMRCLCHPVNKTSMAVTDSDIRAHPCSQFEKLCEENMQMLWSVLCNCNLCGPSQSFLYVYFFMKPWFYLYYMNIYVKSIVDKLSFVTTPKSI